MAQELDDTAAMNAAGSTPMHHAPSGLIEDCSSVWATGAPGAQTDAQLPEGEATQQPPQADAPEPGLAMAAGATSVRATRRESRYRMVLRAASS
jgi:hypothetical protein